LRALGGAPAAELSRRGASRTTSKSATASRRHASAACANSSSAYASKRSHVESAPRSQRWQKWCTVLLLLRAHTAAAHVPLPLLLLLPWRRGGASVQ
jgi:hypothetical protein